MFRFSLGLLFLSTVRLSKRTVDTKNNATFDAVSSKRANCDDVQLFIKHTPKLIIFGTHNLHTFKHNTVIKKILLNAHAVFVI